MHYRQSFWLIIGTVILFAVWELIGHWFLMMVPMGVRHSLSIVIETGLALLIATISIQAIWRQQKELQELAHLRDYLLRMQVHYLRLPHDARTDPQQQLEYRALELKYGDAQKRLASGHPDTRASAFLDLWELARTYLPGMREPYPFFFRAVSHLTAALYLETELLPRDQALHALAEMAAFARDNEPRLMHPLLEDMAHANRAAQSALTNALVERFAAAESVSEDELRSLLSLVRFTESEEADVAVWRALLASPSWQAALAVHRALQKAGKKSKPDDAAMLQAIRTAATGLRDTRDALAQALCALAVPADFPADPAARRYWKRTPPLSLPACFLVGAELNKVQLQGANLQHVWLQAAALTDAQLQNADLTGANLWKAQLIAAGLENAKLWGADLRDAFLTVAHLQAADLSRALLQGAHLTGTNLTGACLWEVTIADDKAKRVHTAVFTNANWWEAQFSDTLTGSTDKEMQTWLKYTFPQPESDTPSAEQNVSTQER